MSAGAALASLPAVPARAGSNLRVVQLLDMSASQQELSRNYATGMRLAWVRLAEPGGPLSRVALTTVQIDGTESGMKAALQDLRDDRSVIALVGSAGDAASVRAVGVAKAMDLRIAHLVPWMPDPRFDMDPGVASIFASRDTQLQQALRFVQGMGIDQLDLLLASEAEREFYASSIATSARAARLRVELLAPARGHSLDVAAAGMPRRGGVVLFMGSTVDLAVVMQAMAAAGDRRMVFGVGGVDHPTLLQLGGARGGAVVLTQVVPNPQRSALACASAYRAALRTFFDEDPSPVSFAGYLAGLYAGLLLSRLPAVATREAVLESLRQRPAADLQGFSVDFSRGPRGSGFVTQTLLTPDGRLVG